jgi:hypothetical protein
VRRKFLEAKAAIGARFPRLRAIYRKAYDRTANWPRIAGFSLSSREAIFSKIYRENQWRDGESRSGPGSNLAATEILRREMPLVFAELGVRTVLDAPCGDFRWMHDVAAGLDHYVGVDIVPELISTLRSLHGSERQEFHVRDMTQDPLPRSDLIICRDCLVHLSEADALKAIGNFRRSGAKYLATTTFPEHEKNEDVVTGWWRPLNLERAPFGFPSPLKLIVETEQGGPSAKAIGVWQITDLPKSP